MSTVKCYHWTSLHLMYSSDLKDLNIFNLSLAFIETTVGLELKNHGNTICWWCTFLVIYCKKKKVTINWWRFWLGNLLGGDKMTGVIGKIEHSAGYYLRCILMERMEKLYKALKNTDNPHGL